jgi:RNA polymerase sigma-70 factor (ECF subfamily)
LNQDETEGYFKLVINMTVIGKSNADLRPIGSLIRQLRAGDESAFAAIYDTHSRLVYGLILRMVRDSALAEDLLQEVFLKLWRSADSLDETSTSLAPWLVTVARRHVLDYLRSGYNQRSMKSRSLELPEVSRHVSIEGYDAVFAENVRYLHSALKSLDGRHREVLELAYMEGLSQMEIATVLRQPLGTVKSWVRLGLQRLREHFESQTQELEPANA